MRHVMRLAMVWAVVTGVAVLAGCRGPGEPMAVDRTYPPDFALVFTVEPQGFVDATDPLQMPSHYVLEADRTLRVALGPGVRHELYPPATATLTPGQMVAVWEAVAAGDLMAAADEVAPSAPVRYRVAITAGGRTHRYVTTRQASPATAALLRVLTELRGGETAGPGR